VPGSNANSGQVINQNSVPFLNEPLYVFRLWYCRCCVIRYHGLFQEPCQSVCVSDDCAWFFAYSEERRVNSVLLVSSCVLCVGSVTAWLGLPGAQPTVSARSSHYTASDRLRHYFRRPIAMAFVIKGDSPWFIASWATCTAIVGLLVTPVLVPRRGGLMYLI
jgi:hypothetical protein